MVIYVDKVNYNNENYVIHDERFNDYDPSDVGYALVVDSDGKVTATPTVDSFNGRQGDVMPIEGDYTADQILTDGEQNVQEHIHTAQEHMDNTNNPHEVTTEQINAVNKNQLAVPTSEDIVGVATLDENKHIYLDQLPMDSELDTTSRNPVENRAIAVWQKETIDQQGIIKSNGEKLVTSARALELVNTGYAHNYVYRGKKLSYTLDELGELINPTSIEIYDDNKTYNEGDIVSFEIDGASRNYICNVNDCKGHTPTPDNKFYWAFSDGGNWKDLFIGDYITVSLKNPFTTTSNYVNIDFIFAGFNTFYGIGDDTTYLTKNHIVLIPRHCLSQALQMNNLTSEYSSAGSTADGYLGTLMHREFLGNELISAEQYSTTPYYSVGMYCYTQVSSTSKKVYYKCIKNNVNLPTKKQPGGTESYEFWEPVNSYYPEFAYAFKDHLLVHRRCLSDGIEFVGPSSVGGGAQGYANSRKFTNVALGTMNEIFVNGTSRSNSSCFDDMDARCQFPLFNLNPELKTCYRYGINPAVPIITDVKAQYWLSGVYDNVRFSTLWGNGESFASASRAKNYVRPYILFC